MGIATEPLPAARPKRRRGDFTFSRLWELLAAVPQFFLALLPRTCHRGLTWLIGRRADDARGGLVLALSLGSFALGLIGFYFIFLVMVGLLAIWAHVFPRLVEGLAAHGIIASDSGWLSLAPAAVPFQLICALGLSYVTGLFVRAPHDAFGRPFRTLRGVLWLREVIARISGL
ncbi:MAG: hypothetical protein J2P46_17690, partial [Zavarzinella sp.]|nr:hypothetical protein [Zavarzinella sp.]